MLDNEYELPENEKITLQSMVDKTFESASGKIITIQKEKITELEQEIVRLKAMLFHFTGKME